MGEPDNNLWDLRKSAQGMLPESDEVYEQKYLEWQRRDWPAWLQAHLVFPFSVVRKEDDDDAYFTSVAQHQPFRLGHTMVAVGIDVEEDPTYGIELQVKEGRRKGYVPLADVEVTPRDDVNFWSVREYVVWFANRG